MRTAVAVLIGLLVFLASLCGCTAAPPAASDGGPSAAPDGPPSAAPPTTGPRSAPPGSSAPPATVTPGPAAEAPGLVLTWDGGSAAGTLGSWTLDGRGSDSPWLPASALERVTVPRSERLTVRFDDRAAVGAWSARVAPDSDPTGEGATGLGEREAGPPVELVVLEPLPPGRWVVAVRLDRSDGRGDATAYWFVVVT